MMQSFDTQGRLKVNAKAAFGDSSNIDAFGRLRVSSPVGLFDSQFEYDVQPHTWETAITGTAPPTATHNQSDSTITLALTSTNEAQAVLRQSKVYIRYQPGRSQLIFMTFNFIEALAQNAVTKEFGYGDDNNGIFLQQVSTGAQFLVRKGGAGTPVAQADWNIDKMDGTGPSGVTLDWTKAQILAIDFEWLGVGRVRCGFVLEGQLFYAHEYLHANSATTTFMRTANLPVRYKISKSRATSSGSMLQICSSVFSEGGFENERMVPFSAGNRTTGIAVSTTRRALISIRPKATYDGLTTRGLIVPVAANLALDAGTKRVVYWELIYNPTFTTSGGALTWTSADAESMVEYCVHADTNAGVFTNGHRMYSGTAVTTGNDKVVIEHPIPTRLPVVLDSSGANPTAISLVVTASGSIDCYGALDWSELR